MTLRQTAALLSATAALALPASAHAGVPITLGNAAYSNPHVTADSDPGVFHVVWEDARARLFHYCQVVVGKPGCAKSAVIPSVATFGNGDPLDAEPAWIVTDPDGGPLRLIMPYYISGAIYESVSINGGTSFTPPQLVKDSSVRLGVGIGRPVLEADRQTSLLPHAYTDGLHLAETDSNAILQLDDTGQAAVSGFNPAVATVTAGTLGVVNDLDNVFVYRAAAGSPLLAPGSWTPSTLVTKTSNKSAFAGNGTTAFLATTSDGKRGPHVEIREWGGMAFGAPKAVENVTGTFADVSVSRNGSAGLVYYDNPAIHYAEINAKGNYVPKTIVVSREDVSDMNVARDDDDHGLVVWSDDDAIRAADLGEVKDKTIPSVSTRKTKRGLTLGLKVPGSCVVAGKKFTVRSVGSGGKGTRKIKKIVYKLRGAKRVKAKKPPFRATLRVPASAAPGKRLTVKAKYYISRKRKPRKFTFTNVLSVRVCGG